eukprot:245701-Prymnesium_polylepis.1
MGCHPHGARRAAGRQAGCCNLECRERGHEAAQDRPEQKSTQLHRHARNRRILISLVDRHGDRSSTSQRGALQRD